MDTGKEAYEKALQDKHGKLTSCSCYCHRNGMMMNSDTADDLELKLADNDGSILTVTGKEAFQKRIIRTFRIKDKDLHELTDFISDNSLWAYSELKYVQNPDFIVYDYSLTRNAALVFDDSPLGNTRTGYYSLSYDAMKQNGFEQLYNDLIRIMHNLETKGELLSMREEGKITFFGVKPEPDIEPEDGETCPSCGYRPVKGKFCPECGTKIRD